MIVKILMWVAARDQGTSVYDIMDRFGVCKRTAWSAITRLKDGGVKFKTEKGSRAKPSLFWVENLKLK